MSPDQEERLVAAFEAIAGGLSSIARTLEIDLDKRYPAKHAPRDIEVHYLKTDEEKMREEQGDTGEETVNDWLNLSWREREYYRQQAEAGNGQKTGDRQEKIKRGSED